jgi:hypothetical protein
MVLRVVNGHFPIDIDGEAPGSGKIGVANFVLCSKAGWNAKIRSAVRRPRKLGQLLNGALGRPGQGYLAAVIVDGEAFVRKGDQITTQAEKAADLQHGEELVVHRDDEIVQCADLLVLFVLDFRSEKLRGAIAFPNRLNVDGDELNRLSSRSPCEAPKGKKPTRRDPDRALPAIEALRGFVSAVEGRVDGGGRNGR